MRSTTTFDVVDPDLLEAMITDELTAATILVTRRGSHDIHYFGDIDRQHT